MGKSAALHLYTSLTNTYIFHKLPTESRIKDVNIVSENK